MKAKIEGEFLLEGFCSKPPPHFQLLHSYFQARQAQPKNTNLFKPKRTRYLTEKYKGQNKRFYSIYVAIGWRIGWIGKVDYIWWEN